MSKKKLIIEDDILLFKDGSNIIIPTAKQIFSWAHPKEEYVVPDMPNLNYSKFPLDLKIKPQLTKEGMKCDVIGVIRKKEIKIKNPLSLSHDHLIHEGYWYPFLKTQLDIIKKIIINSRIENLKEIELGHYTNLLENDTEDDESSSSNSSDSSETESSDTSSDSNKEYEDVSITEAREHVLKKLRNKLKKKYVSGK